MTNRHATTNSYAPSKMPTRHIGAAPTPSGLSPVSSSWSHSAIGLPDVLQSYAQNRRSGTLVVYRARQPHFLGLRQGHIVFLTGIPAGSLLRALVWTGSLTVDKANALAAKLPQDDAEAAREILDEELVSAAAVIDALSCLVEETFHEAFIEQSPEWDLAAEEPQDDWARVQEHIGLSIGISSLLMELMRHRDEYQALSSPLGDPYDLPLLARPQQVADISDEDQLRIAHLVDGQRPAWRVIIDSWMVPSRGRMGLAYLLDSNIVTLADGDQVLARAHQCRQSGMDEDAIGFYRRAFALGAEQPAARYELALLLAGQEGSEREAAAAFFESASELEAINPEQAIQAYRQACRLGSEPRVCRRREAILAEQLGRREDARRAMWELVEHLEKDGEFSEALRCFSEVEPYETDRLLLLSRQGDLAQRVGDYPKALTCWDELEHLLDHDQQSEALAKVHSRILAIDPGRCDTALYHARHVARQGNGEAAAEIIRAALAAAGAQIDPDLAIDCHEFLAEVDAQDAENRQWLARSYRSREDRQGAVRQLRMLVESHREAGNRQGLIDALRELVELDPLQHAAARSLSRLYDEDGMVEASLGIWRQTIDATLAKGEAQLAVDLGEEAVGIHPLAVPLRLLLVKGANRLGHKDTAIRHCLAAAQLARLAGKHLLAKQCLQQALPVLGDDVGVYAELVDLLAQSADEELPACLAAACEAALKTGNYGLAARWAESWVQALPAGVDQIPARQRLIQAYIRSGQHVQAQATAEHLVDDLLTQQRRDEALALLQGLMGHYPRSSNLLTILARCQRDAGQKRPAIQSFLSLIQLLQQEDRIKEAEALLHELERLLADGEVVARLRRQLANGEAVSW
ncbi:MAG: DUF4388 domain-containing protein [Planctomycetota bacterium]|nr:MAG: DUF4388 domain-containing protein [Planctomycetota bacterium]